MKFRKKTAIAVIINLFVAACQFQLVDDNCLYTFKDFAYRNKDLSADAGYPKNGWQEIAYLDIDINQFSWLTIELIREVNNVTEIWFKEPDSNVYFNKNSSSYNYYIYNVSTGAIQTLSANVKNSDAYAMKLFLAKDGTIWAQNYWDTTEITPDLPIKYPLLSKYNEETKTFNFIPSFQGINGFARDSGSAPTWNKILLIENDFWLFVQNDAIYSYNMNKSDITKHLLLPKKEVQYVTVSRDGHVFYLQVDEDIVNSPYILEGEYLLYSSKENHLIELNIPNRIPASASILVDKNDNLWISSVGYYTPAGTWEQIYKPSLKDFFDMQFEGNLNFYFPSIVLEDSDDRLWFHSNSGMGWLNTETTTGCWVTGYGASDIEEDSYGKLWMIVNGHLYIYRKK